MRLLSLSLIFAILMTVVGAGWLISAAYSRLAPQSADEQSQYIEHSLIATAAMIDRQPSLLSQIPATLEAELISPADLPLPESLKMSFEQGEHLTLASEQGLRRYIYLAQQRQILALNSPEREPQFSLWQLAFTLSFYLAVLLAILVWLSPLLRHLLKLQNTAKRFGEGDLTQRVKITPWSYIKDIETAFNSMADQINRLLDDNKLLGRAISHELKNPLARLRLGIDVLSDTTDQTQQRYIDRINNDLDYMQSLIHNLLQYSQLDNHRIELAPEPLELNQFCSDLLAAFEWHQKTLQIQTAAAPMPLVIDKQHLAMIINNLLSNALNHGGDTVRLSVEKLNTAVTISVEDNGPGIPEAEREAVFELFHRNKDKHNAKGHGIGLASVARACDWLGIGIHLDQSPSLAGARFQLSLQQDTKRYS